MAVDNTFRTFPGYFSLKLDKKHPERALQRVGRDLKFTTEQGDVIRPLYDLHHQRYVVYWDLQSE